MIGIDIIQGVTQPGAGLFSQGLSRIDFMETAAIVPPVLPALAAAFTTACVELMVLASSLSKACLLNVGMNCVAFGEPN